jgi:hypothetical protein
MIIYVVAGVALVISGVVIGVLVVLKLGADDEASSGGLTASTVKTRRARAARRVFGLYVRAPEPEYQDTRAGSAR